MKGRKWQNSTASIFLLCGIDRFYRKSYFAAALQPRKDVADRRDKIAYDNNVLSVPAVCQLSAEKRRGKLDDAHDHGAQNFAVTFLKA